MYREGDDLIPIVLRHVGDERGVDNLPALQVRSQLSTEPLPLAQVDNEVVTAWENPIIRRRDRSRTIKIQAQRVFGETVQTLAADVAAEIDAIELPPGYRWEWGGDVEQ